MLDAARSRYCALVSAGLALREVKHCCFCARAMIFGTPRAALVATFVDIGPLLSATRLGGLAVEYVSDI